MVLSVCFTFLIFYKKNPSVVLSNNIKYTYILKYARTVIQMFLNNILVKTGNALNKAERFPVVDSLRGAEILIAISIVWAIKTYR